MATELAKAYVQIVPSAKGISGSLSSMLGGEASSAGDSAGAGMGESLVSKLKGVIAVAAIGKFIGDSITEGAALEQSLGGVETLFKDNADTVKQYAAQAYQTAGVSANDYMEMVTGFSASLLQSTAGDTASAAEIANTAMVDMSDNANKMGTDMGSIQTAYQGFAKQNYTMLDNLKLGYGGTKSEMERLLADAEKITGVKYDINNLSDVYGAIHVIQGELDITGTTAKEASTTISGSMNAMKAAFSNVMGGLALGQDITPALQGLVETTTTFLVGNLIPAVLNIISALPSAVVTLVQTAVPQISAAFMQFLPTLQAGMEQGLPALMAQGSDAVNGMMAGISQNLPGVLQKGVEAINGFISGIGQSLPQVLQQGTETINSIVTGILNNLPAIIDSALQVMTSFLDMVIANLPQILESGASIITNIVTGILNNLPAIIASVSKMVLTLLQSIVTHLPEIIQAGFNILANLITGIGNAMPGIMTAAGEVAKSVMDTIGNTDWLSIGKNIISGIISGISSMGGALWDAAVNIAKGAEEAIKSFFGIASPSKLMRDEVGKYIPLGLAVGIEKNSGAVTEAMQSLTDFSTGNIEGEIAASLSGTPKTPAPAAAAGSDAVVAAVFNIAGQIIEAIRESGGDTYIGDDVIGRAYDRYQSDKSIMLGGLA